MAKTLRFSIIIEQRGADKAAREIIKLRRSLGNTVRNIKVYGQNFDQFTNKTKRWGLAFGALSRRMPLFGRIFRNVLYRQISHSIIRFLGLPARMIRETVRIMDHFQGLAKAAAIITARNGEDIITNYKRLEVTALKASGSVYSSFKEISDATAILAQSGILNIGMYLKELGKLKIATDVNFGYMTRVVVRLLKAFGVSEQLAPTAMAKVSYAIQNANVEIYDMQRALDRLGPTVRSFYGKGVEGLERFLQILAASAEQGLVSSMVYNQIANTIGKLTSPNEKLVLALVRAGVKLREATSEGVKYQSTLDLLSKSYEKLSKKLKELEEKRLKLVAKNLPTEEIDKQVQNIKGQIDDIEKSTKYAFLRLLEVGAPRDLVDILQDLAKVFSSSSSKARNLSEALGVGSTQIKLLGEEIPRVIEKLKKMTEVTEKFGEAQHEAFTETIPGAIIEGRNAWRALADFAKKSLFGGIIASVGDMSQVLKKKLVGGLEDSDKAVVQKGFDIAEKIRAKLKAPFERLGIAFADYLTALTEPEKGPSTTSALKTLEISLNEVVDTVYRAYYPIFEIISKLFGTIIAKSLSSGVVVNATWKFAKLFGNFLVNAIVSSLKGTPLFRLFGRKWAYTPITQALPERLRLPYHILERYSKTVQGRLIAAIPTSAPAKLKRFIEALKRGSLDEISKSAEVLARELGATSKEIEQFKQSIIETSAIIRSRFEAIGMRTTADLKPLVQRANIINEQTKLERERVGLMQRLQSLSKETKVKPSETFQVLYPEQVEEFTKVWKEYLKKGVRIATPEQIKKFPGIAIPEKATPEEIFRLTGYYMEATKVAERLVKEGFGYVKHMGKIFIINNQEVSDMFKKVTDSHKSLATRVGILKRELDGINKNMGR
ncbi:MAG: phage tail tape measure protein [Candidatus Odinarchaeia archaeon]